MESFCEIPQTLLLSTAWGTLLVSKTVYAHLIVHQLLCCMLGSQCSEGKLKYTSHLNIFPLLLAVSHLFRLLNIFPLCLPFFHVFVEILLHSPRLSMTTSSVVRCTLYSCGPKIPNDPPFPNCDSTQMDQHMQAVNLSIAKRPVIYLLKFGLCAVEVRDSL